MIEHNGKLYIHTRRGVKIIHEAGTKRTSLRFISKDYFDYEKILGLDQPKKRIPAITGQWSSAQNCHVVHRIKIAL